MKKTLPILLTALTLQLGANAQLLNDPAWQVSTDAHQDASAMKINAPICMTADGSIYQTGTFDQEITIGGNTLSPIATSAFLAKYDKSGNALWAVSLAGSATITTIDADENGVAVAGVFADEVVVGSTDDATSTINGIIDCTQQASGFIALYDNDGVLQAVKAIVPEQDADLLDTWMYFPESGDNYFKPGKIQLTDNRIYLSATYTANNCIDDIMLNGKVINVWDFMYMDIPSMAIVSFNRDGLDGCNMELNVATVENMDYNQMQPETLNFTVDESHNVHFAFVGYGNLTAMTSYDSMNFNFDYDYEGTNEHGLVVGTIPFTNWESAIQALSDSSNLYIDAPITMDPNMNAYVTGTFDQETTFAGTTFTPVAVSSFLAQYDCYGNEKWAVALQGSATITAIDANSEQVAIAGVFADEVVFGSTDGSSRTINGILDCSEQASGFVAIYGTDGKIQAVKSIVPEQNAGLLDTWMYFPEPGDNYFKPGKIQFSNDRLYMSATYTADNAIDDITLGGKVINVWDFMYMDIPSMALVSFNAATLDGCRLEANVAATEDMAYSQMQPLALNFTVDGNDTYVAFFGYGNLTLTTATESQDFSFAYNDEGVKENAAVVANITSGKSKVYHAAATDNLASYYSIKNMGIRDSILFIAGSYCNTLPFDNNLELVGTNDLFISYFNSSTLDSIYSFGSMFDEGEKASENMMATNSCTEGEFMFFTGYTDDVNTHEINNSLIFMTNLGIRYSSVDHADVLPTVAYMTENCSYSSSSANGSYVYNFTAFNAETTYTVYNTPATDNLANFYDIQYMECQGNDGIIIGGTFSNAFPFDATVAASGAADMFVAQLDGNECGSYQLISGYEEESGTAETFTGIITGTGNEMVATGYVQNTTDKSIVSPLNMVIDTNTSNFSIDKTQLITAAAMQSADSNEFAVAGISDGSYNLSMFTILSRINAIHKSISNGRTYNIYGIEVDSDCKGIVIKNGKTYLQ